MPPTPGITYVQRALVFHYPLYVLCGMWILLIINYTTMWITCAENWRHLTPDRWTIGLKCGKCVENSRLFSIYYLHNFHLHIQHAFEILVCARPAFGCGLHFSHSSASYFSFMLFFCARRYISFHYTRFCIMHFPTLKWRALRHWSRVCTDRWNECHVSTFGCIQMHSAHDFLCSG